MNFRTVVALSCLMSALAPATAGAAGPGDDVLVSGPAGLGPLDPGLSAWNGSGRPDFAHAFGSDDVTADGRYAVFVSSADGLAPGEDLGVTHVFRKDLVTGTLVVVDTGSNGSATDPTISDDGRYVAFASVASNLAAGDGTRDADVFVKDLQAGTTALVTPAASGPDCLECLHPVLSGNGSTVAFATRDTLVAGDTGTRLDVYARAAAGGPYTLVSATPGGTTASNGESDKPSITTDGTTVAFLSTATDLDVGDDPNNGTDAYVRVLALTSAGLASAQNASTFGIGFGSVQDAQISGDGTKVVFTDNAAYVAADTDGTLYDVYRRILGVSHVTELMSLSTAGVDADLAAFGAATDGTGTRVAFTSSATNLGGATAGNDLYVRDTGAGTTTPLTDAAVTVASPAVSDGAGAKVVFFANAPIGDGQSPAAIHAEPVGGGTIALVSAPSSGQALLPGLTAVRLPNFTQSERRLSTFGRYAVFASDAPALGGPAGVTECWRRDLRTGALDLISKSGATIADSCFEPTISAEGTRVAFMTFTSLSGDDTTPSDADVYLRDLSSGTTSLVSRADGGAGANSDGTIGDAEISGDGRRIGFVSNATNLGVPAGDFHLYVRDTVAGTTQIADRFNAGGAISDKPLTSFTEISLDDTGGRVAFDSTAQLAGADTDVLPDIYVRDLGAATTTLASVQSDAAGGAKGTVGSSKAVLSADGRHVVFTSAAQNLDPSLAPWPGSATFQIFSRDLDARTTTLVSRSASGTAAGDASVFNAATDAGGDVVAFDGTPNGLTTTLTPDVNGGEAFIIVRRLSTGATQVVHFPLIEPELGLPGVSSPVLSEDGRCLGFFARARGLAPGLSPDFAQMFARPLEGDCGTLAPGTAPVGTPSGNAPLAAPRLSKVSLTRRRFRVGARATALSARRTAAGTTIRFTLSSTATVTIRFTRSAAGRRSGRRCVAPTRRLRRAKACRRTIAEGVLTRRRLSPGAHRVAFSGRVGRRALKAGSHAAALVAADSTGQASAPVTLTFRIVRR